MAKTFVIYCPDHNVVGFYGFTAAEGTVSALGVDYRVNNFPECPVFNHEGHSATGVAVEVPYTGTNSAEDSPASEWITAFNTSALEIARPILQINEKARIEHIDIEVETLSFAIERATHSWMRK